VPGVGRELEADVSKKAITINFDVPLRVCVHLNISVDLERFRLGDIADCYDITAVEMPHVNPYGPNEVIEALDAAGELGCLDDTVAAALVDESEDHDPSKMCLACCKEIDEGGRSCPRCGSEDVEPPWRPGEEE